MSDNIREEFEYRKRVNEIIEKEKSKLKRAEKHKEGYEKLMSLTDTEIKFCNRHGFNEPSDIYYSYNGIGLWKSSEPNSIIEVADTLDPVLKTDPAFMKIKQVYRKGNKLYVKNLTYRMECKYDSRDFYDRFTQNLEYLTWRFLERKIIEKEYNSILDGTNKIIQQAREVENELELICKDFFKTGTREERNLVPC